jgi:hypothetical protein
MRSEGAREERKPTGGFRASFSGRVSCSRTLETGLDPCQPIPVRFVSSGREWPPISDRARVEQLLRGPALASFSLVQSSEPSVCTLTALEQRCSRPPNDRRRSRRVHRPTVSRSSLHRATTSSQASLTRAEAAHERQHIVRYEASAISHPSDLGRTSAPPSSRPSPRNRRNTYPPSLHSASPWTSRPPRARTSTTRQASRAVRARA